jgi:hypothetical protein
MTPGFALVIALCTPNTDCIDVVKNIFDTKAQCEQVIFDERIFNAACYEIEEIIPMGNFDTVNN